MNTAPAQRGAALIVALVMMLLMTLMVTGAFSLSGSNLKAVGNMQNRNEAIAAANVAIERVMSSAFTNAPVAESLNIDLDNDNRTDYVVAMAAPTCLRVTAAPSSTPSSASLPGLSSARWNTVWNLDARVDDAATGASVHVRSGVRVLLTDAQKNVVCP
ncbi:hypothetical protein D9M68_345450 [compost metagenome]